MSYYCQQTSYYCHPCGRDFTSVRGYDQHMANSAAHYGEVEQPESDQVDEWLCNYCDFWFATENECDQHMQTHDLLQWECNFCDYCFTSESACDQHMQTHAVQQWECNFCDHSFTTESACDQHMQTHAVQQWECYACDRSFTTEREQWRCEDCSRSFPTKQSLHQHCSSAGGHPYCSECKRMFMNQNNLNQHLRSRTHQGSTLTCPGCKESYTTASGLTVHFESSTCSSGINRHEVNDIVRRMDHNNVITRPMLTMPNYEVSETIATKRSWNGYGFECYFCENREFTTLRGLNRHLKSPAHEQNIYHCPKGSCERTYKLLSGLVMYVESESCGIMRFNQVQEQARGGIHNMVGRMINL